MDSRFWNPDSGYTFAYENGKVIGVLASCPYCGHQWVYKGGDKNIATCHGRVKTDGFDHDCGHKVRLHPYLLNLKEKQADPFGRLLHNHGRTNRSYLKYPNRNYDHISEMRK